MTNRKRPPAPHRRLAREIPPADWARLLPLLDCARNLGIGVSGTRGVGKSQLLRLIAWLDFAYHDVPTIVVDPVGPTTDGILGQIPYLHPDDQRRLWRRIRYVNLSPASASPTPSPGSTPSSGRPASRGSIRSGRSPPTAAPFCWLSATRSASCPTCCAGPRPGARY
ncbi:MAG: hypothetical protein ACRDJW_01245 [Thermomicrobiales bacterium]